MPVRIQLCREGRRVKPRRYGVVVLLVLGGWAGGPLGVSGAPGPRRCGDLVLRHWSRPSAFGVSSGPWAAGAPQRLQPGAGGRAVGGFWVGGLVGLVVLMVRNLTPAARRYDQWGRPRGARRSSSDGGPSAAGAGTVEGRLSVVRAGWLRGAGGLPQTRGPGRVSDERPRVRSPLRPSPDRRHVCGMAATAAVPDAQRRSSWLDGGQPQTRARHDRPAEPATRRATATTTSSRCSRAPFATSRRRCGAAGPRPRHARGSRPSRCCCATSAPGSARRRPGAPRTAPSGSSVSTASRRSSRRPPSGMPGSWRSSTRTRWSPTRRGRSSGRC